MFTRLNSKLKCIFGMLGLAGLAFVVWLILALNNIGNEKIVDHKLVSHSPTLEKKQTSASSFNNSEPTMSYGSTQTEPTFEDVDDDKKHIDIPEAAYCSAHCDSALSALDQDIELDDKAFDKLEAYINEIATYLASNEARRQFYLEMALTTLDGDKRGFLTDVFRQLPYAQKAELGDRFIDSDNWLLRADGVTLIADTEASNSDLATKLLEVFAREENPHIKDTILNQLKQAPKLRGDIEVLQQLDSIIYKDTAPSVRVTALKAKMQLSEQPHHIIPDAIQALRTTEPEFQLAGLTVIDQILANENKHVENGAYIDKTTIKTDIENIRNMTVYEDNEDHSKHLIREANSIYMRHFQYH